MKSESGFSQNSREKRLLQDEFEEEFGTGNHPKRDKLFELAWEYGNSSGKHGVRWQYKEFLQLLDLKPETSY